LIFWGGKRGEGDSFVIGEDEGGHLIKKLRKVF